MMGEMARAAVLFLTALAVGSPRWVLADAAAGEAAPAPSWAQSVEVVNDGAPLMLAPDSESRRRGTVGAGTRLGFTRRVFGEGCSTGVWYETSDQLFICEGHVQPSPAPPGPKRDELAGSGSRLPQRYAFVRFDGTRAYAHPSDYFRNDYSEALGKGYRCVRVVHGKGHRSPNREPVLKRKMAHWLQQKNEVLAYCEAPPVDGGSGATVILLKAAGRTAARPR